MHWQATKKKKKEKNKENLMYSYRFTRKSWYFKFSRLPHDTGVAAPGKIYQLTKIESEREEKSAKNRRHIFIISSIKFMQTLTYFPNSIQRAFVTRETEKSACFVYIGFRCLNHRYAISIKGWIRWSGCSLCMCVCALLPFGFVFSICRLLCITLVWKWNLCARTFTFEQSERCLFRSLFFHSLPSYECFHCTQKIRKFACTSLLASLCFALFLLASLLAPRTTHSSPSPFLSQCICLF